ncbi:MAG: GNAT family N-acetyltransferase [Runella slithyformis]|nr:MAG: GNAT family N-acetyltransferase [Runella slithyformis]
MTIKTATNDHDILKCWEVMHALRPHLEANKFLLLIKEMQTEGYCLVFIEENNQAVAAVGFRYLQFLFNGKHIYIDDLSTLPEARGKGYGAALLDHVLEIATQKGYIQVTLDSGYQRHDAHRLYLNKGFKLGSHHFVKVL